MDVDAGAEVATAYGIQAMPTFYFIKNGQQVGDLQGANFQRLQQLVQQHA